MRFRLGQHGENVPAIRPERQRRDRSHRRDVKVAVQMWKQRAAARRLEAQTVAEPGALDLHQKQVSLAGKVFGGGLDGLFGGRKMDEAVFDINRRTAKNAVGFGGAPHRFRADLINEARRGLNCHNVASTT